MKKTLLYILLHFSLAVFADWITVEHDFNMCGQVIHSEYAAVHINDDGIVYSTSLLARDVQTVKHEPPLTTVNITMWGCTYDCHFSYMLDINRNNLSVSSYTKQVQNNYKCLLSNYTMNLIPIPKITYKQEAPDPDYVFPTHLTAYYCSKGKHPDAPGWSINQTEYVAECIDHLTGNEVGTYAASLQYGSGSSFNPEGYGVATYHMINSANKLFNHWESHHRGFHHALNELSIKMDTHNLKELAPPPPPPHKKNLLKEILVPLVASIVVLAVTGLVGGLVLTGAAAAGEITETAVAEISEAAAEVGAADDVIASASEGSAEIEEAEEFINEPLLERVSQKKVLLYTEYAKLKDSYKTCFGTFCPRFTLRNVAEFYEEYKDTNMGRILAALNRAYPRKRPRPPGKRDTVDNIGFFTTNMVNVYFLPSLMDNVHQSFTGNGQVYPDISSYLSAASEKLQIHFDDTLHNNFFTANKSILAGFTVNQRVNNDQMIANDDEIYHSVKQSTYNNMAASIISNALQMFKVEICDPKPSFCGQPCGDSGHIYCPIVGNHTNSCVLAAADSQINELKFLRDILDICSTDESTGWNITHNRNCDIKQFQCR